MNQQNIDMGAEVVKMEEALRRLEKREAAVRSKPVQLPIWPMGLVGTPNALLRGSLFKVAEYGNKHRDPHVEELIVDVQGENEVLQIWYTGRSLTQEDLTYLDAVLYAAGEPDFPSVDVEGAPFKAGTAYAYLKVLGREHDSRAYHAFNDSMLRLRSGHVRIVIQYLKGPKKGIRDIDIGGSLILHAREGSTKTGRHLTAPHPMLKPLFEPGAYSLVNLRLRMQLRKPLAMWLHAFYSTHAKPVGYSIQKLRTLCGSRMSNPTMWRKAVRAALDELKAVGFLKEADIDKHDVAQVERAHEHVNHKQLSKPKKADKESAVDPRQHSLL